MTSIQHVGGLFRVIAAGLLCAWAAIPTQAQELEPRRWSHLPTGSNFSGLGYAYTKGDIGFDPVLLLDGVEMEMHTTAFKYIHTFELFEKSARIDFHQAYQTARWAGLLDGTPASTSRTGISDSVLRFSMNLLGAPPLEGKSFADYRAGAIDGETIVGAGLAVHFPTGNYLENRLLNLGSNRFTFRPQLGVVHNRGPWSWELTGSAWLSTDNSDFYGGNQLEQKPFYTIQGHAVYTFKPGLWIAAGVGYGRGAESTLNGIGKNDSRANLIWGIRAGFPITRRVGVSFGYIGSRTQEKAGSDLDTLTAGISFLW